ncbi:MAG: DUF5714 domain-containing protein, partial [Candidatus Electrothrix sp.]
DKRRTYLEIMRILKPGGRLVVADVVSDEPVSAAIKNSTKYRGECLGGAMQQDDLVAMLEDCGFASVYLHKRFPYREVEGHRFYSLTYEAGKAEQVGLAEFVDEETKNKAAEKVRCLFRGPAPTLETATGQRLERGRITELARQEAEQLGEQVFLLDEEGAVVNVAQEACCCGVSPEEVGQNALTSPRSGPFLRYQSGCIICGEELVYQSNGGTEASCSFCGCEAITPCICTAGHYVCDSCHQQKGLEVIRSVCLNSSEKDMIALLNRIRNHPAVPMHGPEHHAMVPGVILAAYRNNGGAISQDIIATGIDRGSQVPGGVCGFWGCCGAAVGVGIAASLILEATPLKADERQNSLAFTAQVLTEIAKINGGRCCQRDSWLALTHVSRLSKDFLGIALPAETVLHCNQYEKNQECIRKSCPLWEEREWKEGGWRGGQIKKGAGSTLPYPSST